MPSVSRRDALRLGAAGVAGLLSLDLLAGCDSNAVNPASLNPNTLVPFRPDTSGGHSTGLPGRVAWASTADSEFFLALGRGMKLAAAHRGVDYVTATSGNDPGKHVDQMNAFLRQGVGALAMQPLSPDADALVLRRAIDRGVCAQGIITAPSTMQVVASQYQRPTTSQPTSEATPRSSTSTSTPPRPSSGCGTRACSQGSRPVAAASRWSAT